LQRLGGIDHSQPAAIQLSNNTPSGVSYRSRSPFGPGSGAAGACRSETSEPDSAYCVLRLPLGAMTLVRADLPSPGRAAGIGKNRAQKEKLCSPPGLSPGRKQSFPVSVSGKRKREARRIEERDGTKVTREAAGERSGARSRLSFGARPNAAGLAEAKAPESRLCGRNSADDSRPACYLFREKPRPCSMICPAWRARPKRRRSFLRERPNLHESACAGPASLGLASFGVISSASEPSMGLDGCNRGFLYHCRLRNRTDLRFEVRR
jgi:hypothetical protein